MKKTQRGLVECRGPLRKWHSRTNGGLAKEGLGSVSEVRAGRGLGETLRC